MDQLLKSKQLAPFVPTPPQVLRWLRRWLSKVEIEFPPRPGQPVAYDAGCGEGLVADVLARYTQFYTLCVELFEDKVKVALLNIKGRGLAHLVDVVQSDITVFRARRVDLTYTFLMPGVVDLVVRNLPPGGMLVSLDFEASTAKKIGEVGVGRHVLYFYEIGRREEESRV